MTNENSKIIKARINAEKFEFVARCLMLDAGYSCLELGDFDLLFTIDDLELLEDRGQKAKVKR